MDVFFLVGGFSLIFFVFGVFDGVILILVVIVVLVIVVLLIVGVLIVGLVMVVLVVFFWV